MRMRSHCDSALGRSAARCSSVAIAYTSPCLLIPLSHDVIDCPTLNAFSLKKGGQLPLLHPPGYATVPVGSAGTNPSIPVGSAGTNPSIPVGSAGSNPSIPCDQSSRSAIVRTSSTCESFFRELYNRLAGAGQPGTFNCPHAQPSRRVNVHSGEDLGTRLSVSRMCVSVTMT